MSGFDPIPTAPPPAVSFFEARFRNLDRPISRLGLSATYRPGRETVHRALDVGVGVYFCYGFDSQMTRVLNGLPPSRRQQLVYITGAYNLLWGHPNLRRSLEKRLRQLGTDYLDCFFLLGVMGKERYLDTVLEELERFRQEGKVLFTGVSIHARKLAGKLAARGRVQAMMLRYNAAHRGAETDIFPYLNANHPAVVSYTATRWTALLRRPRDWPKGGRIPTPGMCYRFVLANPHIHVCLTAPRNLREFEENLAAVHEGPLCDEDMQFMRGFGDVVHAQQKWFM